MRPAALLLLAVLGFGSSAAAQAPARTVNAVRIDAAPAIDGVLAEPIYESIPAMGGFIQIEPRPGDAATEQTEMWILFDEENLYLAARMWDSDPDRIVATELRRDNNTIFQGNDLVGFSFDTFYDRRNNFTFITTPAGARMEGQVTNERQWNGDWNPVWEVKTARFDGGWTMEAAVPFKSLRYRPGVGQVWGFNGMRVKRSKGEVSFLTQLPPGRGQQAFQQMSLAATLVGIEPPPSSRPLDLKPYVTSSLQADAATGPRRTNRADADVGFDAKYALTQGLTADLTVNTDFAQVEADEQQVNLTRFSLFFPEKRDFFLENLGTFVFGGVPVSGNNGGIDAPALFYSRRIGLNSGTIVPLRAGGRVTGRAGAYSVGVVNIQTGEGDAPGTPAANFSVVRLKRDILSRSAIGVIATNRSVSQTGSGGNQAVGVDATFGFFQNLTINTFWARTRTEGLRGDDQSYRAQLDYTADRYTVQLEQLAVGDNFNPEIGFVRRDDVRRSNALFKFSPRLARSTVIRKLNYQGSLNYVENGQGRLESREQAAQFAINFLNNDSFFVEVARNFEYLPRPFEISSGVVLPVGGYGFTDLRVNYNQSQQRSLGANMTLEIGNFYSGRKTTLTIARGRVQPTPRLSFEPTYSLNAVSLAEGEFTTHLAGTRVTFAMTPLMFASALAQYSSSSRSVSVNARLRWEYQPGSELFVVYNEQRDTGARAFPAMQNRALIVKVNRLFRF
jgi:hypothetical protein